jgi:hypothetical protein
MCRLTACARLAQRLDPCSADSTLVFGSTPPLGADPFRCKVFLMTEPFRSRNFIAAGSGGRMRAISSRTANPLDLRPPA